MCISGMILFLVFLIQQLVSSDYVEDWNHQAFSYQLAFPRYRHAQLVRPLPSPVEVTNDKGDSKFVVHCENYEEEESKANIFNKEGIFIDTITLASVGDPCTKENLQTFILPQDSDEGNRFTIIYLWSGKSHKCVERSYEVTEHKLLGIVIKYDYPLVPCPPSVAEYIRKLPDKNSVPGILSLGPMKRTDSLEFNANVESKGRPYMLEFPTVDPEGKRFKMICRKDKLTVADYDTQKDTITSGRIIHEDNEDVVLDELKMPKCTVDFINVNRKIVYTGAMKGGKQVKKDFYKITFKTVEGECYQRMYEIYETEYLFYYNQVTLHHYWPKRVKCPDKWVGDIDVNAWRPWYKKLWLNWFGEYDTFAKVIKEEDDED